MEPKSFVFRAEWNRILSKLPQQVRLEVYEAIIEYGTSGTLPTLKAMAELAFDLIRKDIDEESEHKKEISERRRGAAKVRWRSRKKSGDAKNANASNGDLTKKKTPSKVPDSQKNNANYANASFAFNKENVLSSPLIENTPTPLREYNPLITPPKEKEKKKVGKKNEPPLFPNIPGGYEDYDFSYVEEPFAEPFFAFIRYRKDRRDRKFTPTGLKTTYKHLKEFSLNDPATAKEIVEQTIANNWMGLFPLRTNNGTNRRPNTTAAERTADAARDIASFILDD